MAAAGAEGRIMRRRSATGTRAAKIGLRAGPSGSPRPKSAVRPAFRLTEDRCRSRVSSAVEPIWGMSVQSPG
jgi:hypothetical protein